MITQDYTIWSIVISPQPIWYSFPQYLVILFNSLNPILFAFVSQGEAKWSLCVTCGAWLALQGYDHLTFLFDREVLLSVVLPSLRGIASFFLGTMIVLDSISDTVCVYSSFSWYWSSVCFCLYNVRGYHPMTAVMFSQFTSNHQFIFLISTLSFLLFH